MTQRPTWFLFAVVLVAGCPCYLGSKTEPEDTDTTVEVVDECLTSGIKGSPVPANGARDVPVRGTFYVEFIQDESTTATFTLVDHDGADVALGEVQFSDSGRAAWVTPADALAPSSSYALTVDYSCQYTASIQFTTSATGAEVAPDAFLGDAYSLDLASALIVEPIGVNALLGSLLGQLDQDIVVVPESFDPAFHTLTFYGGLAAPGGAQDLCQPTTDFPAAASYLEDPTFELDAPEGLSLQVGGFELPLLDLSLTGSFTPDAASLEGVGLSTTLDTRALSGLLGDVLGGATGDSAVCDLIGQFTAGAVACEACPDTDPLGEGDYCLTIVARNAVADRVDWTFARVTQADVDANPECAPPAP